MPIETIVSPTSFCTIYLHRHVYKVHIAFYLENYTYIYTDMLAPALSFVRYVTQVINKL